VAYWVLKIILTPVLHVFYRVRVEGREHIPGEGPVVIACNHVSFCDSVFLPLVLRRRITFVAKAEYFEDRRTAWFFRAVGQIPIVRGGGSDSERALVSARAVLDGGGVFGIYPEGTRSPDGRLYKGHTGVARLALQCHAPVVCAALCGTREAQPIGARLPRPFSAIRVRFGPPLRPDELAAGPDDPLALRRITDEIMWRIGELSGQEYVDTYAKRGGSEGPGAAVAAPVVRIPLTEPVPPPSPAEPAGVGAS